MAQEESSARLGETKGDRLMDETFNCDRCGREFPRRQLKEAFHDEGGERVKRNLCPTCLDEVMNESDRVLGVSGDEKQAAVHLEGAETAGQETYGERS
jgi:hypothetical protein